MVVCDRLSAANNNDLVSILKTDSEAITFVREQLLEALRRPQVQRRGRKKACVMTAAVFAVCAVALVLYESLRAHWKFDKAHRLEHGVVVAMLGCVALVLLVLCCRRRQKVAAINAVLSEDRAVEFLTNPALASVQPVEVRQALANMAAGYVPTAQP